MAFVYDLFPKPNTLDVDNNVTISFDIVDVIPIIIANSVNVFVDRKIAPK